MITVELRQLRFFANHGLYAEEKKTGNEFEVNLSVSFELPVESRPNDISATINYVSLYEMVKEEMQKPADLLETLATGIERKIKAAFPQSKKISIAIAKLHPPIPNFTGSVSVSFEKEY